MRRFPPLCLALLLGVSAPAWAHPVLERVVLLQRHGVRAPTKVPDARTAASPWPQWPVPPGELTDHGRAGLARIDDALRRRYAALLAAPGCGGVFVWGDAADQRTRESAKVFAAAMGQDCAARVSAGGGDPLFHPTESDVCAIDPAQASAAIAPRLDALMQNRPGDYRQALAALNHVLGIECQDGADCSDNRIKDGKIQGPLALGSTLSENIFLEYAQGMPAPGWGRAGTANAVAAFMPLHNMYTDLARRTPYLADKGASLLAHQIAAALTGETPAFRGSAPVPADARLVAFIGHDTNLSNLAGALNIDWSLPGQPDATAPGTVLAFEVWRDGARRFVRLVLFYPGLDDLRSLTPFTPAHRLPSLVLQRAGCGTRGCAIADMHAALMAIGPSCIQPD